ncbi:PH domain-containing protein [Halomicroarcula sp. GCM10025709]|uniref:PH domain-containing protein n=1 Tax=Halomicroarcula sp. GCM10025709 TaxID=3252669 RepID=UPI00360812E3
MFAVGFFLFSRGLYRYWQHTLTTYFLTNQRVLEEYRFISLLRNEVPLEKVRGVEERRSAWESLFGLGTVAVRSGASGGLTVSVGEIYEPSEFADLVRSKLTDGPNEGQAATEPDEQDTARSE